jgi:RNA polymerase-binding transcription factor DksA
MATTKPSKAAKKTKPVIAKKAAAKPVAAKVAVKKPVAAKLVVAKKAVKAVVAPVRKAVVAPVVDTSAKKKPVVSFGSKDLAAFEKELLALRDRLTGQVARMREDSLKRDDEVNPEEDGTDAFDRLFVLERAGSDQEIVFSIDEALRAIKEGKYGVCDGCGNLIEKPRLQALPFTSCCIKCQSEKERGPNGNNNVRRMIP